MVRTDQPIILRELLLEHRNSLGPGTAGFLLLIPAGVQTSDRNRSIAAWSPWVKDR